MPRARPAPLRSRGGRGGVPAGADAGAVVSGPAGGEVWSSHQWFETCSVGAAPAVAAGAARPPDAAAGAVADTAPEALLADWRATRTALHDALVTVPEGRKLPWFGPPMSAASMATARLMETWAHGQDVADALGARREPTERLREVMKQLLDETIAAYPTLTGDELRFHPARLGGTAPTYEDAWAKDHKDMTRTKDQFTKD